MRNYAIAVTWYGLMDLCHRDIIREGDGLAMMAMWRINTLRFWCGNHYKYMNLCHNLLAGRCFVYVHHIQPMYECHMLLL